MNEAGYLELTQQDPKAASQLLVQKDLLIKAHEQEILKLQQHLINANKARFGRKSEKLNSSDTQGQLFEIEELKPEVAAEPDKTITVPEHTRAPRKARTIPEGTPVNVVNHAPAETQCGGCGNGLEQIRTEESQIVEYIPAHFEVTRHIRPVMVCKRCKDKAPITTKLPAGVQLIERSSVGVGLLSHILISKYQDHQPLYRLEGIFARHGFEVPRQRMCDWLAKLAELLQPLYLLLKKELLKQNYLQADETTVDVLDEDLKKKCHTGYFWGILAPPEVNLVLFHYADSRASPGAEGAVIRLYWSPTD